MSRSAILVVEDNPIARKMMRVALAAQEYAVLEAPDGRTALALAARKPPDLILQDLRLADMDGFDLVRALRRLPGCEALPILAVSGFLSRLEEARASTVGFTDFLVKPVLPSELIRIIQGHLPGPARRAKARGGGRCVLLVVVDDDPAQRTMGRTRLLDEGFQVVLARDGMEALELARRSPPDAIVSDILMPRLDGLGLCLTMRRDPALAHVPVVLASNTRLEDYDARLARSMGASALVVRTPDFGSVVDALLASLETPPDVTHREQELRESHIYRIVVQLERQTIMNAGLAQRCAAQAGALSLLRTIAESLSNGLEPEVALEEVLGNSLEAGGFSMGSLYLIEDDGGLALRARSGYRGLAEGELEELFGHEELFRQAIETGVPIAVPSPAVPEATARDFLGRAGTASALIVPLELRGSHIGALVVATDLEDLADKECLDFARTLGRQISLAIALARQSQQLTRTNATLEGMLTSLEKTRVEQLEIKNQFLSHVSHELRSPLAAVHQFVTIVRDGLGGELAEAQRRYLDIVLRNVDQLRAMIGDLLAATHVEAGLLSIERRRLSIGALIVSTVAELRARAATKGLALSADVPNDLPPGHADPLRVREVLVNLVENAIKFTPPGGAITVRARTARDASDLLSVSVADTGCGISPEGMLKVFERFHQETKVPEESRMGLGLGLYICKELVEHQGGRIWVESEPGKGSVFSFTLPAFSLGGFLKPLFGDDGRLGESVALITVQIAPQSGSPSGVIGESLLWQAWTLLTQSIRPDVDLVLPRSEGTTGEETFYVVARGNRADAEVLAGWIRQQFNAADSFRGTGITVRTSIALVVPERDAGKDLSRGRAGDVIARIEGVVAPLPEQEERECRRS